MLYKRYQPNLLIVEEVLLNGKINSCNIRVTVTKDIINIIIKFLICLAYLYNAFVINSTVNV